MRKELFYNPKILIGRLAELFADKARLAKLKRTVAKDLGIVHITSLEFIELANKNHPIKVVYDIGANEGTWSQLVAALIPNVKIQAFEPIPEYQKSYIENLKNVKDVVLHKIGLGSENKITKFNFAQHASSFLEISNNLTAMFPSQAKTKELEVEMVKLDDLVTKTKMACPDLMKLDVEGFELEVLKGAKDVMKQCKYIILEVSFMERHVGQPLFHEVVSFMAQHNFIIYSFPKGMHLAQKIYMTDVLFENQTYAHHTIPNLEKQ